MPNKPVRAGLSIERAEWQDGRAYIDDLHYFNVPEEAWNMQINGWQIAKKWLMDRKMSELAQSDINEYHQVIAYISSFIVAMKGLGMQRYIKERVP